MRHETFTIRRTGEKTSRYTYELGFCKPGIEISVLDTRKPWATLELIADDVHSEYHVVNTECMEGNEHESPIKFKDRESAEDLFYATMHKIYHREYQAEIVRLLETHLGIGEEHIINEN